MLSADILRSILKYFPETGEFFFRRRRGSKAAGDRAGSLQRGYVVISVQNWPYRAHRLAWLYTHGSWPAGDLDHINGDPSDNRIANLREATPMQNSANAAKYRNNTSGYKGVSWNNRRRKWQASIKSGGVNHHLGLFDTAFDGHKAYLAAARVHFGEFARAA